MQPGKRTILWIIPIAIIGIFYYFYGPQEDITDNDYISYVQQLSLVENSNVSIEEALSNYCEKSSWVFFKTQMRKNVVEFKGECQVDKEVQPVNLQFVVDKEITKHELGVLLINHVQQTDADREKYIEQVYMN
ncbi:glucosamine 6-phosphate synthetase [Solibacillus sp. FSL H8-0538]|uniref:glucosamine 6-phosphate synthetase n=1 Tax=Solibacillus sp. FSL H8-0538 TaxID=2921400 RepID=UPI0030F84A0C